MSAVRHSLAHVLAAATRRLYGDDVKFGVGPAIEDGFYYDMDLGERHLSDDDLAKLEQEMRKIGEVLPIYTNDKQYYLEISKENLNRDLLVSGIIVNGPWSGESSTITDRVCFTLGKDGKQLDVMQEIWDVRIDSTKSDAGLVEAFKASNMPSVKWSLPVHAYGKDRNSYIVDITKDVTNSGKLFGFPNLQWVNRPVANRFSIDTIQVLKEGVKFLVIHSQTDRMKGGFGMQ